VPVCCVNLGTVLAPKASPRARARARTAQTLSVMGAPGLPR
jgi:hypothetical protein